MLPFEHDIPEHGKQNGYNNHDQKTVWILFQRIRYIHPVQAGNQGRQHQYYRNRSHTLHHDVQVIGYHGSIRVHRPTQDITIYTGRILSLA